jgi:hypothetical protein
LAIREYRGQAQYNCFRWSRSAVDDLVRGIEKRTTAGQRRFPVFLATAAAHAAAAGRSP